MCAVGTEDREDRGFVGEGNGRGPSKSGVWEGERTRGVTKGRCGMTGTKRQALRGLGLDEADSRTTHSRPPVVALGKQGGLRPQGTCRIQPVASRVCCPLPRLSGYGGCPHLWPLLLPPRPEPPIPNNDAHPNRCPGFHGRSHLVGVSGIRYEVSTLSVWPGLESSMEIITKLRNNKQLCETGSLCF